MLREDKMGQRAVLFYRLVHDALIMVMQMREAQMLEHEKQV